MKCRVVADNTNPDKTSRKAFVILMWLLADCLLSLFHFKDKGNCIVAGAYGLVDPHGRGGHRKDTDTIKGIDQEKE